MLTADMALKLAQEAYTGSTNYFDANVRLRIEKDIRRFQSRFPSGSKYLSDGYKTRSRIFRPKTRSTIRKNEAVAAEAFFTTLDMVSILPTDQSNDIQSASADVMSMLLQHRLTKSIPWFQICIGAYQDAQVTGLVISHQTWKYNPKKRKDQPIIEIIPIENFRFDPASSWYDPIGTSPYLIRLIPMFVKDVRSRMDSGNWIRHSDEQMLAATKLSDSTRLAREENRSDPTDKVSGITQYSIVWVHQNILEWDGDDYVFYTLGESLPLSDPKPLEDEYAHGIRPFVLGNCVIEAHKTYVSGSSSLGAQIQDEINEVTNQRLDNVKFAMNKRYFVRRNKQVDLRSLTRNTPSSVTLMTDPDADVKVVDTPDVTSSSYNEQDRLNLDYDDVAGVFSGASVQSNRKLSETVGGMNILTSNANQVSSYQLKTFVETWVEPVLRQLMMLEQSYETDDILIGLSAKKAKLFQKYGIDVVTDDMLSEELTLSVNVGIGSTNPSDKVNTLSLGMGAIRTILQDDLLERYGLRPEELIKEILGALGHKDGGRFFDFDSEEDPRIESLTKQIGQLQQALAAKHPPEVIAAQVEKLKEETKNISANRVKAGVEGVYSAMQSAQVIAATPQTSPIADEVMKMAGWVTPNPAGIDPNLPQPAMQNPMNVVETGTTNPLTPAPPTSPFVGQESGIETQEADGVIN